MMWNIYWERLYDHWTTDTTSTGYTKWKKLLETKPREKDHGVHFILISLTALLLDYWQFVVMTCMWIFFFSCNGPYLFCKAQSYQQWKLVYQLVPQGWSTRVRVDPRNWRQNWCHVAGRTKGIVGNSWDQDNARVIFVDEMKYEMAYRLHWSDQSFFKPFSFCFCFRL